MRQDFSIHFQLHFLGNVLEPFQTNVVFLEFYFQAVGFALLGIGIWLLVDPKRNYILDFVDSSGDEPLLKYAAYIFIAVGSASILVGFVGCCGALKESQLLLVTVYCISETQVLGQYKNLCFSTFFCFC